MKTTITDVMVSAIFLRVSMDSNWLAAIAGALVVLTTISFVIDSFEGRKSEG